MSHPAAPCHLDRTTATAAFAHLLGAMSDGASRYITDMEAAGQRELVGSDTLPSEAPWDELEQLGFTPGEPVPGDPLFRHCTLPDGWKREGSDHAMWSYIVDERGVRRVGVFYKAAFYDRRADATIANPGRSLATEAIYGDGGPALPEIWGVLTDQERDDFRASVEDYLRKCEEYPTVYGDRKARVAALREMAAR